MTTDNGKKLIDVALPLEAINAACKADKNRKTGTIRNLHKWFAPMPPPAWRALLFAALVDDPGDAGERARLLRLTELMVSPNRAEARQAQEDCRRELRAQHEELPTIVDPFCGGGSTIVETPTSRPSGSWFGP